MSAGGRASLFKPEFETVSNSGTTVTGTPVTVVQVDVSDAFSRGRACLCWRRAYGAVPGLHLVRPLPPALLLRSAGRGESTTRSLQPSSGARARLKSSTRPSSRPWAPGPVAHSAEERVALLACGREPVGRLGPCLADVKWHRTRRWGDPGARVAAKRVEDDLAWRWMTRLPPDVGAAADAGITLLGGAALGPLGALYASAPGWRGGGHGGSAAGDAGAAAPLPLPNSPVAAPFGSAQ